MPALGLIVMQNLCESTLSEVPVLYQHHPYTDPRVLAKPRTLVHLWSSSRYTVQTASMGTRFPLTVRLGCMWPLAEPHCDILTACAYELQLLTEWQEQLLCCCPAG